MMPNYNYYQPYYPMQSNAFSTPQNVGATQQNVGIIWVQGEAGAKSYLVAAGKSVLLMDSESSTFYIKSTDQSGMPMPLRVFDYKERSQATPQSPVSVNQYVTHEELEKWTDDLMKKINVQEGV